MVHNQEKNLMKANSDNSCIEFKGQRLWIDYYEYIQRKKEILPY